MRPRFGRQVGQSHAELTIAVTCSFLLHAAIVLAAAFFTIVSVPRLHLPPQYMVNLVSQPQDASPVAPKQTAPVAPPKEQKQQKPKTVQKQKQAAPVAKKAGMPQLTDQKQKPQAEQEKPAETREQPRAASSGPVAVTASQQDFPFGWYLALIREKIGQNWRPPPDAKDATVRVEFTVNRSGWLENVKHDPAQSSGTFGFQQAAIRAIRSSNPFPPLPEEFSKLAVSFSVDLKAE